jgi:hypothetical protein
MRNRSLVTAFWLAVILAVSACGPFPITETVDMRGVLVINETPQTLSFKMWVPGDRWYDLPSVARPRDRTGALYGPQLGPNSAFARDGCTIGDLVAFAPDGHEVARHGPHLCRDDVWTIADPSAT